MPPPLYSASFPSSGLISLRAWLRAMREGFVSDGRGFPCGVLVSAVASGAFDPDGASNLVWPHMAASAVSLAKGLVTERLREHKNRVLSATDHWQVVEAGSRNRASGKSGTAAVREDHGLPRTEEDGDLVVMENGSARFGREGVIKEVVGSQRRADGSGEPGFGVEVDEQKAKEVGIELPHATDVLHKNGSDGLEMNNVSGLRTVGILNSSSTKESVVHSLSNKTRDPNIPSEQKTTASNSNAAHHATNSIADQTRLCQMLQSASSRTS